MISEVIVRVRLYERWISYPVDQSYPMDKSSIQWIAVCRIKRVVRSMDSMVDSYHWIILILTGDYDFAEIFHPYDSCC
jgi:hypothetical protein